MITSYETILNDFNVKAAVIGGAVYGGGGGGSIEDGFALGDLAMKSGKIRLLSAKKLKMNDILLTVSTVGAPAAENRYVLPAHYVRAVEYFAETFHCASAGLIANECGASATVNGFLQAAALNLPVIDAPCNGRAHPLALMGSMGLHQDASFSSCQTAVGGNPQHGKYIEIAVRGSLAQTASIVRNASIQAGGLIAVARNPVTVRYAKRHAAVGAIQDCIELGESMLITRMKIGAKSMPETAALLLGGSIVVSGIVESVQRVTCGGFDVGTVSLSENDKTLELSFLNAYMTLEIQGERIATFPDLITTFDSVSGLPISSAQIETGMPIQVLHVHRDKIRLGAGMHDPALYTIIEKNINKRMKDFIFH